MGCENTEKMSEACPKSTNENKNQTIYET